MANYIITTKKIRGFIDDVLDEMETYLEGIDDTSQTIISVNVVGDNNYVTALILHKDTS